MSSLRIPVSHNRDDDGILSRTPSHRSQNPDSAVSPAVSRPPSPLPQYRNVVIPDPTALAYLEEDKSVIIVERKAELKGYELYLVEQWACSRKPPTSVIVTFTGDERHSVVVGVLSVPADDKAWSPRLRVYFKAIHQHHARPKYTDLGELMVTNLSSFPSALTVISVACGDIKDQRKIFIINEDLKRLGCSGRSGINLSEPTAAAKAKFHQLYKTDEKVATEDAVLELVKLCQVALHLFGILDKVYIDGLLCDLTETAIGNWWTEFGCEYFNMEPADGILGPTTVAALLGLLMGAKNRLNYLSFSVPKDVFDMDATGRGISSFQKHNKLERTRRLDRQTMRRLHLTTAKAAAGEGWGVQKAVKSTVSEIGGRRGEAVLGMVSGRDKGGIGDIETTDIDRFIALVSGERSKWLWHGKAKRAPTFEHEKPGPEMITFGRDDPRSPAALVEDEGEGRRREESPALYTAPPANVANSGAESPGDRDALRRGAFKNVARSGLRQIKDAVTSGGGFRGHGSRPSRDESSESNSTGFPSSMLSSTSLISSPGPPPESAQLGRAFTWKEKPEEYMNGMRKVKELPTSSQEAPLLESTPATESDARDKKYMSQANEGLDETPQADVSTAPSLAGESTSGMDKERSLPGFRPTDASVTHLCRRRSIAGDQPPEKRKLNEARWSRRLSFSHAEDAILTWEEIADFGDLEGVDIGTMSGKQAGLLVQFAQALYMSTSGIEHTLEPWVDEKLESLDEMGKIYSRQMDELQLLYQESSTACERSRHEAQGVIVDHREHLTEAVNRLEGEAAKMEYEIAALKSRVEDVEDATIQFEMQVEEMEARADELKTQLEKESWLHWAVRTLTGIGTGPNITKTKTTTPTQKDT